MFKLKPRTWVELPNELIDNDYWQFWQLHHSTQAMLTKLLITMQHNKRNLSPEKILNGNGWSRMTVWNNLKILYDKGFLMEDYKLAGVCKAAHVNFTQIPVSYLYELNQDNGIAALLILYILRFTLGYQKQSRVKGSEDIFQIKLDQRKLCKKIKLTEHQYQEALKKLPDWIKCTQGKYYKSIFQVSGKLIDEHITQIPQKPLKYIHKFNMRKYYNLADFSEWLNNGVFKPKLAILSKDNLYQNCITSNQNFVSKLHHFKTTKNLVAIGAGGTFPRCIKDNILRIYKRSLTKDTPKSPKGIFQDFIFDMNSNIISYYITLISTSPLNCYMILYNYSLFMLTSPIRVVPTAQYGAEKHEVNPGMISFQNKYQDRVKSQVMRYNAKYEEVNIMDFTCNSTEKDTSVSKPKTSQTEVSSSVVTTKFQPDLNLDDVKSLRSIYFKLFRKHKDRVYRSGVSAKTEERYLTFLLEYSKLEKWLVMSYFIKYSDMFLGKSDPTISLLHKYQNRIVYGVLADKGKICKMLTAQGWVTDEDEYCCDFDQPETPESIYYYKFTGIYPVPPVGRRKVVGHVLNERWHKQYMRRQWEEAKKQEEYMVWYYSDEREVAEYLKPIQMFREKYNRWLEKGEDTISQNQAGKYLEELNWYLNRYEDWKQGREERNRPDPFKQLREELDKL